MKRRSYLLTTILFLLFSVVFFSGCTAKKEKKTLGGIYGIEQQDIYMVSFYYNKAGGITFFNDGCDESQAGKALRYGQELLTIQIGQEIPKRHKGVKIFEAQLRYDYKETSADGIAYKELGLEQYDNFIVIGQVTDEGLTKCKYYENNIDTIDAISRLKEMLVANKDDHDFGNGNIDDSNDTREILMKKPVVYLYPKRAMDIQVKLDKINLTCAYPTYQNGWKVTAKPNGTLVTKGDNRRYYCLYYEGEGQLPLNRECGFIVKRQDYQNFLEEKLEILGLNEREAQEFIIYWLPVMQEYDRLFVYFVEQEVLDEQIPLMVSPKPDSLIRVFMQIAEVGEEELLREQKLTKIQRKGYTVVEWGGGNWAEN